MWWDALYGIRRCFFLMVVAILLAVAGLAAFDFWLFLRSPGSPKREVRRVEIQPGSGAASIAQLLYRNGIVSDAKKFYLLCRLRDATSKLKAGEYIFSGFSTPDAILERIVQGKVIVYSATVPEGSTIRDVARILEAAGLATQDEILRTAEDREFIDSLGFAVPTLEGYLFPETYHFQRPLSGQSILKPMVREFQRRLPDGWRDRARQLGYHIHEVVTVASMVEKEAVVDFERPLIAAVFYNRLKLNMHLQSDPTAVYDLPGFSGPVTAAHLKRQSPYNTYLHSGLPPGPICSPGERSLRAALYPAEAPYLYFVSNNDGTHRFSRTLAEHNTAVNQYRSSRNAAGKPGEPQPAPSGPDAPATDEAVTPPDVAEGRDAAATK